MQDRLDIDVGGNELRITGRRQISNPQGSYLIRERRPGTHGEDATLRDRPGTPGEDATLRDRPGTPGNLYIEYYLQIFGF